MKAVAWSVRLGAAAVLSGCLSITLPPTRGQIEAEARSWRDLPRYHKHVRNLELLMRAPGTAFSVSEMRALQEPLDRYAADVTNGQRVAASRIELVRSALATSFPETAKRPLHTNIRLKLELIQKGQAYAYLDPVTQVFRLDTQVLRAIYIAGLARMFREHDLDAMANNLEEAKRLFAEGRMGVIHESKVPDPWAAFGKPDDPAQVRRRLRREWLAARSAEDIAADFFRVLSVSAAFPDSALTGTFQLSSGAKFEPVEELRRISLNLLMENFDHSLAGVFITVLLHEMGHLALQHHDLVREGVDCETRKRMELEADMYSAVLRGTAFMDAKYGLVAGIEAFAILFVAKGPEAKGIEDYFEVAYGLSGFDRLAGQTPHADARCYPSAEERRRMSRLAYEAATAKAAQQSQDCWLSEIQRAWREEGEKGRASPRDKIRLDDCRPLDRK